MSLRRNCAAGQIARGTTGQEGAGFPLVRTTALQEAKRPGSTAYERKSGLCPQTSLRQRLAAYPREESPPLEPASRRPSSRALPRRGPEKSAWDVRARGAQLPSAWGRVRSVFWRWRRIARAAYPPGKWVHPCPPVCLQTRARRLGFSPVRSRVAPIRALLFLVSLRAWRYPATERELTSQSATRNCSVPGRFASRRSARSQEARLRPAARLCSAR